MRRRTNASPNPHSTAPLVVLGLGPVGLVTAAGFCDLSEGGGVDVQALYITDDLIAVESIHVVVDLVSSLSENALGFNNAMSTVLVAFECHK